MTGDTAIDTITLSAAAVQSAALWIALHLLLLVFLSARVVSLRRRHRVGIGDGGVDDLALGVRAFGNAAEYAGPGLVAILALAAVGAPLLLNVVGATLFAGRLAHALGLSRSSGLSVGRTVGMVLTYTAYIVAAASLLFYAF